MKRTSLITLIILLFSVAGGFAQQASYADFEEFRNAMEGRWIGEVTWITDWPGMGNKGDKTTGYTEINVVANGRVMMGSFYGGNGTNRWFTVFDAGSGQIRETGADSGGTTWDCVISKQDGQWTARCSGSLADGTKTEGTTRLTISDSGNTHTWTGETTIGDQDADPLNDVWRRVGK